MKLRDEVERLRRWLERIRMTCTPTKVGRRYKCAGPNKCGGHMAACALEGMAAPKKNV